MQILPYIHNIKSSIELAKEHIKLHIHEYKKLFTINIDYLCNYLPKRGIIMSTRLWLQQQTIDHRKANNS